MPERIAVLGGIYSNYLALEVALADIARRDVDAIYCLGDLGAFGPHPDRVFPLLREHGVQCIQGNYDNSLARGLADCQCGYTDPRDNHFARLSYAYTFANTSPENRAWLGMLPLQRRLLLGGRRLLLCHGSPRQMNEFLWESTTSTQFLQHLRRAHEADVLLTTHTGIKWCRELPDDGLHVNVGVLGRPENDGSARVWYALLELPPPSPPCAHGGEGSGVRGREPDNGRGFHTGASLLPPHPHPSPLPLSRHEYMGGEGSQIRVEFVPVEYDHDRLAREMRAEGLPEEFIATILTGWWTTCLEVLPAKERRRGRW